jgi:hypothetical protein
MLSPGCWSLLPAHIADELDLDIALMMWWPANRTSYLSQAEVTSTR